MTAKGSAPGGRLADLYRRVVLSAHSQSAVALLIAAGLQTIRFFLLARGLGVLVFGQLMVFQAMAEVVVGIVSLGAGEVLMRMVARDRSSFGRALGHGLILTVATGLALAAIVSPLALLFDFDVAFTVIAVFLVCELLGSRLAALCEQCFVACGAIGSANLIKIGYTAFRLAAVVLGLYVAGANALSDWMLVQGVTTLAGGLACLLVTIARLGSPVVALERSELGFGALIAVTAFSATLQTTVDRIFLGVVAAPTVVSIYAAARRALELGEIPLLAMLRNLFPELFRTGVQGPASTLKVAVANLPRLLGTSGLAVVVILAGADVLAMLLGPGFEETAPVLRWLALVIPLRGTQFLLANVLTASGHQGLRTWIEIVGGAGYVGAIVVLTMALGLPGLIAGIYFAQVLFIVMIVAALAYLTRGTSSS